MKSNDILNIVNVNRNAMKKILLGQHVGISFDNIIDSYENQTNNMKRFIRPFLNKLKLLKNNTKKNQILNENYLKKILNEIYNKRPSANSTSDNDSNLVQINTTNTNMNTSPVNKTKKHSLTSSALNNSTSKKQKVSNTLSNLPVASTIGFTKGAKSSKKPQSKKKPQSRR